MAGFQQDNPRSGEIASECLRAFGSKERVAPDEITFSDQLKRIWEFEPDTVVTFELFCNGIAGDQTRAAFAALSADSADQAHIEDGDFIQQYKEKENETAGQQAAGAPGIPAEKRAETGKLLMRTSVIKTSITTISHRSSNDFCRNQSSVIAIVVNSAMMLAVVPSSCLARRIDGIAKQGLTGTRARPLELLNQSTSIVVETIEV